MLKIMTNGKEVKCTTITQKYSKILHLLITKKCTTQSELM